jgi:hypothetical protein
MEILEVKASEYAEIVATPYHVFGSASFNELNKNKCSELHYLLFKEGKFRLGIIGGRKDDSFCSPFSAPFGGFTCLSSEVRLQYIESSLELLKEWATEKKYANITIILPPTIYAESFITKQSNCMYRKGYTISTFDLNHSVDLGNFVDGYLARIWYNARKNLRFAESSNLRLITCISDDEKLTAYNIIKENRNARGFPLRMEWKELLDTSRIIQSDFFMAFNDQGIPIASAVVFQVNQDIVKVIYWGDLPEYSNLRSMNFLSYSVFSYYNSKGVKIVDIGHSTVDSIPNYGLCEFKESLGCDTTGRFTFLLEL